jgi:hypothetical protein
MKTMAHRSDQWFFAQVAARSIDRVYRPALSNPSPNALSAAKTIAFDARA